MIRKKNSIPPDQVSDNQELLQALLQEHVPSKHVQMQPVALRSVEEQRRLAFKSFLQRTWVDHTLHRAEKFLSLAVIAFFTFWLLNGYVRDWLYIHGYIEQQQTHFTTAQSASTPMPQDMVIANTVNHTITTTGYSIALPFTDQENQRQQSQPDYIAPQSIVVPSEPSDQRPYHMYIPAIDLDTPIKEVFVEHGIWQVADYAVGYHHGSALPFEKGNTVMAGHAGWRGSVFRKLHQLQQGDTIIVYAGGWQYEYQVYERKRVRPTDIHVMAPTSEAQLTLITCTDWDTKRLVVVASLSASRPL